jgi:hypothetical protein
VAGHEPRNNVGDVPEVIEAEVFHRPMEGGRNKAALVSARSKDGLLVDCVIKMAAGLENPAQAPAAFLFEWLAAVLAARLGICAARPYEVTVSREFAEAIKDPVFRRIALASIGSAFGAAFMAAPFTQYTADMPHAELLETAAMLLAFDVFVHNPDRRRTNPNLLVSKTRLFAFDHGEAFSFVFALFGNHATDPLLEMLEQHALSGPGWLRGRQCNFRRFRSALSGLTDEVLTAIVEAAPPSWMHGSADGKLLTIIEVLRQRRDAVDEWLPKVEAWLTR